ncbi:MAG TPA: GGDEF domain-containing protein [Spirochaetota bacterium]|nr:GGDEF domain-containing protein [Spirochaetota bacterium]HPI89454.1 GGDEF domain-containing protein [Spirochaetota bacterium]HPR46878.1 GGDEF domain-containing protein [Spirochaetota bacterium]
MPSADAHKSVIKSDIFSLLSRSEAEQFISILSRKIVRKGETIFLEGARGREMYILDRGAVVSRTILPNGKPMDIARFGPGDFFGDMSIFENAPRSATCFALEDSELLRLNDLVFLDFTENYPEIAARVMFRMLNIITARLREKSHFLGNMVEWGDRASKRAITDEISCIYNRRFLDDALEKLFRKSENSGKPMCLVMIDIDDFTKFDEICSNDEINEVIRMLISSMQKHLRENDILARYGGDEFSIILPDTPLDTAVAVCQKICDSVAGIKLGVINNKLQDSITISIGVAAYPDDAGDLESLQKTTDQRLYYAKNEGKNRVKSGDVSGA